MGPIEADGLPGNAGVEQSLDNRLANRRLLARNSFGGEEMHQALDGLSGVEGQRRIEHAGYFSSPLPWQLEKPARI